VYSYYSKGKITVSGTTTKITSANVNGAANRPGTVCIIENSAGFEMTNGTIENTAAKGTAVYYNCSSTSITGRISGGTISATTGIALYRDTYGAIQLSGGLITSANPDVNEGTVYVTSYDGYSSNTHTFTMTSGGTGTIENTSISTGCAIRSTNNQSVLSLLSGTITKAGNPDYAIRGGSSNSSNLTVTGTIRSAINESL